MRFNLLLPLVFGIFMHISCSSEDSLETSKMQLRDYNFNEKEYQIFEKINDYRFLNNLPPIELVAHISSISEEHNWYMIENNRFSHDNFSQRAQTIKSSFGAKEVSENLAYNIKSANAIVNAWIRSNLHQQTLLGEFTHIGISVTYSSDNKPYCTAIFVKK